MATIPQEYTATYNLANEGARTKADAIICSAVGETVTVSDSSDDYLRGLKIFGKTSQVKTEGYQLFDADHLHSNTLVGATVTNNGDGSFTVSGSGALTDTYSNHTYDYSHEDTIRLLRPGTYTLKTGVVTHPYVYLQLRNASGNVLNITGSVNATSTNVVTQAMLDDPNLYMRIGFYGVDGTTIAPGTVKPMLYIDGDGTWEPYSGGYASPSPEWPQDLDSIDNPTATVYCKNLLRIDNTRTATMLNGITIATTEGLSEFVLGGTQTGERDASAAIVQRMVVHPGTYTFSVIGLTSGDYVNMKRLDGNKSYVFTGASTTRPVTFTVNETRSVYIELVTRLTSNYANNVIKIQMEAGSAATAYEPYMESKSITSEYTLPGLPVTSGGNYTDSNGQQWICDEIDFERGVYVRRIYTEVVGADRFTTIDNGYTSTSGCIAYCYPTHGHLLNDDEIVAVSDRVWGVSCDKRGTYADYYRCYGPEINGNAILFRYPVAAGEKTLAEAKEDFAGSTVSYILAEPIETPLTADEIAAFKAIKSNYPNTTVLNDAGAGMLVRYNADTETWIENLIDEKIAAAVAKL